MPLPAVTRWIDQRGNATLSRASQAAGVWLMVRCPHSGLPIGHTSTRAGAPPREHAAARRRPGREPGCGRNAGNVPAGGGEPSTCLGKRTPTASRYMAACGPDRRPCLPAQARHLARLLATDCGSPRLPVPGGSRGLPCPRAKERRGQTAKLPRGRHDRYRREPCFCYTGRGALGVGPGLFGCAQRTGHNGSRAEQGVCRRVMPGRGTAQ